jgi:hypothetical protein
MHCTQRIPCGAYPFIGAGSPKRFDIATVSGEERGEYSITVLRESVREQRKRLRGISKTMQEENSM